MSDHGQASWISFADLMASAVAVVVVMFVVSASTAKIEKDALKNTKKSAIEAALREIQSEVLNKKLTGMVRVDVAQQIVTLEDATFESASACIQPQASRSVGGWSGRIRELLDQNPEVDVFVEGHTDSKPLTHPMNRCGSFDDNYTLSTVRARNARDVLVGDWPALLQSRVFLAGFGPSHPLSGLDSADPRNRRVAIRLFTSPTEDRQTSAEPTKLLN
jgi:chemotaxis protein MotB